MAGGSRKEYELLLKLKAALGGNFSSTFETAMNTTKGLQNSLQSLKKIQGDITSYKKTQEEISKSKSKVQEYTADHDKLKQRLADSTKNIKELEKALDKSAKATGKETEEYKRLESELKKAKEDKSRLADQTSKTAAAVDRANGKVTEQEQKLGDLKKNLDAAGINTGKLTQENDKLSAAYDRVKKSQEDVARVNQKLDKNAAAISATKSELTKTLGGLAAGGAAFYAGAIKPASDFESAFAGVKKTIDGTPEQLQKIRDGIRKMATQIPLGTTEISAIAESAGQLGIKTESILGFTRVMADLGVTTNLTGEEAASTLAKFANITGMSQTNFDRLGSTIVALGNDGASTESDIAAMGLRLAGAGKQIGLSEAQILAFSSALSSVGIEAEAGGSAFSKVMSDMQLAVETGNKKLAKFSKVAGVSSKDFQKAFKTDAAGAINLFIKGLSESQSKGVSAIRVLDDMGITEIRMRDTLLRAAGASDVFSSSLELGTKAWQENKALSQEAKQRYATTESALKIMRQSFNDIGISLGSVFLPKLAESAQRVSELALRFSEFSQKNPQFVKTIIGVAGSLGVIKVGTLASKLGFLEMEKGVLATAKSLLGFKGKVAESIAPTVESKGKVANYFNGIKSALGGVDASMSKFNFAKNLMGKFDTGSLGGVVKGQAGGLFNNLLSPFKAMGGKVGGILSPIGANITGAFGKIGGSIANGPLGKVGGLLSSGLGKVGGVFKSLGGVSNALLQPLGGLGGAFGGLFGKVLPIIAIVSLLATLFVKLNGGDISGFIEPLQTAFEAIKPTLSAVMEQLKGLGEKLMPMLLDAANQLAPLFFQIAAAILPVLASVLQAIVPIIATVAETILPVLIGVLTTLMPPLTNLITSILPVIKVLIDALIPVITILASVFGSVLGGAINAIMPIIQNIIGIFQGLIDFITGVFTGNWTQAWEGIKGIFGGIFGGLTELVKAPFRAIVSVINGVIGGLNKLKVPDWVPSIGGSGINIPLIPTFEKGSNYTPDTFIAGDVGGKGGELVTGARGRKVFTAAQTDAIFANINRMRAFNAANNMPQTPQPIPTRGGQQGGFVIQYSPTIYVDGNKPGDLEEKLKQNNETLLQMFKEFLRRERENERRMAYA